MKQKSNWQITKIIAKNLARLIWAIIVYATTEFQYRIKWFYRDILALLKGYGSHSRMIQSQLDHNHRVYRDEKRFPAGFFKNGRVHPWKEMPRY